MTPQYDEIQQSVYLHGNSGVTFYGRSSGVKETFLSYKWTVMFTVACYRCIGKPFDYWSFPDTKHCFLSYARMSWWKPIWPFPRSWVIFAASEMSEFSFPRSKGGSTKWLPYTRFCLFVCFVFQVDYVSKNQGTHNQYFDVFPWWTRSVYLTGLRTCVVS